MAIVRAVFGKSPKLGPDVFLAENATVVGDVELGAEVGIWYGAVLRADCGFIRIGARSNIQDLACVHMTTGISNSVIGEDCTVGHGAIIHGATIGDRVLVGMGSVVLDNAEIGDECLIAAGTVVPPRLKVPPRMLVRGTPGKIIRELTDAEAALGIDGARTYVELAREHRRQGE